MWTAILTLAASALGLVAKLWGGSDKADARTLGRAEQQNADSKADVETIKKANVAAKKAEQEEGADDPNNRP
jgi:hypothetical protein